ncbi:MAG: acyl-CoA carboxylase subunit beta [Azospirillum sp.]|nr:acyl-CoA carboxylase subunit beta [Azospirillum sp.]
MTLSAKLLETLKTKREALIAGGGADKLAARHAKGLLGARERLAALFQPETFQEIGLHVRHAGEHFGIAEKELPADAVIVGTGLVGGRTVAAISQDFMVSAGSLGLMHARKIVKAMELALKLGVPMVAFKDSGGARIQEGVAALAGYGEVFYHNVLLSGVVPQIAVIAGPCAGGASYSPALMDFIIMIRRSAHMFITGPEVIRAVTGRTTSMDEVGSAEMHSTVSGNVHFVAENEAHAIEITHRLLSYLPPNNAEDPPHHPTESLDLSNDEGMNAVIPDDSSEALDVKAVIHRLVDNGEFLEVHAGFAGNMVVGFGRLGGLVVGIVANQPMEKAGAIDIDASDKAARFIRTCNAFNIPLITLVDVPGFLPGFEQERAGIIRHGAKLLFAYASATVPKLTVVLRKAYGGAYVAMCSQPMGADFVYAWPTAEIAVMGAEGAVNILYSKELKGAENARARAKELAAEYRAEFASPYMSASKGFITDVIEPGMTRATLALSLRKILNKRELRPAKKHGNIPL